jgi:radical SAM superfamily enzyme YgiQ (UPF0313 family)
LCKKAGLLTLSFNMIGIPDESPSAVLDTIKLNAAIGVDIMQATIYQPYQGTKLGELCREHNLLRSEGLGPSFFSPTVLNLDTLSPSQILMFKKYFRALTRYYQLLQKLPPVLSQYAIRLSDKILSLNATSKILNILHVPFNYLYLRLLEIKLNAKMAQIRFADDHQYVGPNSRSFEEKI